ncbi:MULTISPECIES: response regulator transcription factor [Streptomyces]|uniref:response regulator transcription factor n=1 Tax=Streptomyces TaxID=1883 RepID=UPI002E265CA7|nr:response regulator transcription factor [Streptomyces canus]WSZ35072.1 response regulator transcription factor [Streptomyces sp. NBC_00882]WSZ61845.1 response regulator transcription factor [Streptomyces canus]
MHTRILLAEEVHMVRGALAALLDLEADMQVVASVSCGNDIVPTALETRPDVAVLDIDLPGTDGLTAATELHQKLPSCRTLILTSIDRPGLLRRALAAHVLGFLLKEAQPGQLAKSVRAVAAGQRAIDPELLLDAWNSEESPLSARETEVLRHAARGADADEIANSLCLSKGTVRNYLTSVVSKLGARNRIDAVRIAYDQGWLP